MNRFTAVGCCLLLMFAKVVNGQSTGMAMHHHGMPAKNVFISMMDSMMLKMDTVKIDPSTDISFFRLMRPHHQAALEMAVYEIEHGKNAEMRSLAKSILAEQAMEINLMKIWEDRLSPGKGNTDSSFRKGMDNAMQQMMTAIPLLAASTDIDYAFASVMKPHHQAGIDMARAALVSVKDQQTISFSKKLISEEQIEIDQMSGYLNEKK